MKFWCDSEVLSQDQSPALKLPLSRVVAAGEGDLLIERNFILWRTTLTHFIHLSRLVVTPLSGAGKDQRCPGVAQHYFLYRAG